MSSNETIVTLLNRRSIRKFKPEKIDDKVVDVLEAAAQHAPSSEYLNDWSALRIKDAELKHALAEAGRQPYIAEAPLLYVFVLDQRRNMAIAAGKGVGAENPELTLLDSYRFAQAQNDAVLALHAMETAANSLDLGCVLLGSLLNDIDRLIDLLKLPSYTYPVLGLAIGKPDQSPALKPRMPRSAQFFDDAYPTDESAVMHDLSGFDEQVHQYYDLRDTAHALDAFSDQIAKKAMDSNVLSRAIAPAAARQGFHLDR